MNQSLFSLVPFLIRTLLKTVSFLVSSRRKKDSVASIIIDTRDSLNTPLIIKTQSIESLSETDETTSRPRSVTPTIKYR